MEAAKCSSIWGSLDAICEESEMIAHLQSVLWCSSDSDANLCSLGNDTSTNASFDLQVDDLGSANERNIGIKRKMQVDEESDHHNEVPGALSVSGGLDLVHFDIVILLLIYFDCTRFYRPQGRVVRSQELQWTHKATMQRFDLLTYY